MVEIFLSGVTEKKEEKEPGAEWMQLDPASNFLHSLTLSLFLKLISTLLRLPYWQDTYVKVWVPLLMQPNNKNDQGTELGVLISL